jgi:hypothetical protein
MRRFLAHRAREAVAGMSRRQEILWMAMLFAVDLPGARRL